MTVSNPIASLVDKYLTASKLRPEVLFRDFLPAGYRHTTLSSVADDLFHTTVLAKVHLGMIITLYDDFADHPQHCNPELLVGLYRLNIDSDAVAPTHLSPAEKENFELARYLFSELSRILSRFPNHAGLRGALRFDIEQFYSANRFSELMTTLPQIRNLTEARTFGPHNMGIVAAGIIDLMASPNLALEELGACREVFHLGQRAGRISNLIYTYQRELCEGDSTNEISIATDTNYPSTLLDEFSDLVERIGQARIKTFDTRRYARGFVFLHSLHASLAGKI